MNFSFQIARLFGIPIQIHWTFGLVIAWIIYVGRASTYTFNWPIIGWTSLSIFALFACVVLHELGHALTARYYGVKTRKILLLPIGGLAVLDQLPDRPKQEFVVALAGPMVNFLLGILFLPLLLLIPTGVRADLYHFIWNPQGNVFLRNITFLDGFLFGLVVLNLLVALFNLIPAFPMDGGRILRALLSMRMKRVNATRVATYFGQIFAVALVLYGIMDYNPLVAFIGVFVFFAAASEFRAVKEDSLLENHTVAEVLRPAYTKLYQTDPVQIPLDKVSRGVEKFFLVFDDWQNLVGVLNEKDILKAARLEKGKEEPVSRFSNNAYRWVQSGDSLQWLLQQYHEDRIQVFPVVKKGKIIGIVDISSIENFLLLQRNLQRRKPKAR